MQTRTAIKKDMKTLATLSLGLICSLPAFAQNYSGTYTGTADVRAGETRATLTYRLDLTGPRARLSIKKSGRVAFDDATERSYGDVMEYLERNSEVICEGGWSSEGGFVRTTFNRLVAGGRTRDIRAQIGFVVERNRTDMSSRDLTTSFFGMDAGIKLKKSSGGGNSGGNSGGSASGGTGVWLQYTTGGTGTVRFTNGESMSVNTVKFRMYDNGKFGIIVNGRRQYDFAGTWRQSGNTLNLTYQKAKINGRDVKMDGTGRIEMRDRNTVRRFTIDGELESSLRDVTLDFRAAAG